MRIFPITSNRINATKTHLDFLNQQCNALLQFKNQFCPGFKILNETPIYYTYEELIEKGILKLAKLPVENELLTDAIIVVASKLKYGEGIINTLPYSNVYIFYETEDRLNAAPYSIIDDVVQIPQEALSEEHEEYKLGSLYINSPTTQYVLLSHNETENATAKLSRGGSGEWLNDESLVLRKFKPNRETVRFSDSSSQYANISLYEFGASSYIVSRYANENNEENITNEEVRRSFLIARLARGGGYYKFAYTSLLDPNTGKDELGANFEYTPEATDTMGLSYIIDGDPRQKRFIAPKVYGLFSPNTSSAKVLSFILSEDNESIFEITTSHKGVWSGNNLLNHEFYLDNNEGRESFIVDDIRTRGVSNINKVATPSYQVDFSNSYGFTPLFILW